MIPFLTSSCHRELDSGWMPGTDTGYFPKTFVCLSGQFLTVPSGGDSFEPFSFRHSYSIYHFILSEDAWDRDRLLKMSSSELYFLSNSPSIHLDLHDVRLFLSLPEQLHLWNGRGKNSFNCPKRSINQPECEPGLGRLNSTSWCWPNPCLSPAYRPDPATSLHTLWTPSSSTCTCYKWNLWSLRNLITRLVRSEAVLRAHRMLFTFQRNHPGKDYERKRRKEKRPETVQARVTSKEEGPRNRPSKDHKKERRVHSPVLVKPSPTIFGQVFGKNRLEWPQSFRSLDVANDTEDDHWRSLQDGHGFDNLLLIDLCKD